MSKLNLRNALLISAGLHLVWTLALSLKSLQSEKPQLETVTIDLLPAPPESAKVEVPKKRAATEPRTKQIVEQDEKSLNKEKPVKDAYLSANDQRVERETMAAERGDFRNRADKKTAKAGGSQAERSDKPSLKDLMGDDHIGLLKQHEDKTLAEHKNKGEGEGSNDRSSEASRNSDYLKNVEVGSETMLNTREFKYYTYYTRIRKQLAQYWEPKVRQKMGKMFKQGRRIASEKDHITKLLITLNESGQLVRVQVLGESGVQDLDDAATEAFRAAAPFPNPPQGIVESDGTVKIRWDFVLES